MERAPLAMAFVPVSALVPCTARTYSVYVPLPPHQPSLTPRLPLVCAGPSNAHTPFPQGLGSLFFRTPPRTPDGGLGSDGGASWHPADFGAGGSEFGGTGDGAGGVHNPNSFSYFSGPGVAYGQRRRGEHTHLFGDSALSRGTLESNVTSHPSLQFGGGLAFSSAFAGSMPAQSSFVGYTTPPTPPPSPCLRAPVTSTAASQQEAGLPNTSAIPSLSVSSQERLQATPQEPSRRTRRRQRPYDAKTKAGSPSYSSREVSNRGSVPVGAQHRSQPQPQRQRNLGSNISNGEYHVPGKVRRQVRAIFERAKEEERNGHVNEARDMLRQCLTLDRRDAHSWLALARLEARTGGVNLRNQATLTTDDAADGEKRSNSPNGAQVARALFEEGLNECPNSVHLLQAWAVLEHRCGDRDAARKLFGKGLALEPDNPYVCQAWGLLEQRVGNTEKARDLFSRSVSLRPHPEVCAAWAVLEAREGNVARARELYDKGLRACKLPESPSSATIYRSWAEMEERIGDLPRARELLSKAIASQPRVTEAYVALGRLEARRSCTTRALELMRTAAGLSNRPPPSVFNAWAQIEWTCCGRINEARSLLERGHKLHPSDPALLQTWGTLEDKCGNTSAAKKFFFDSVCARPTAPAFVAWALLEERDGNYEESVRLFEEALTTDALHGAAYNAYGMMEARRGNLAGARTVYERGLKVFASASVWHGFGQLELKLGRNPDRARELFRQGVGQTREDTAFIWHSWGMLELAQKRILDARQVFHDALKRYPRNSRVLVGAALAEAASGQRTRGDESRARDFFKRAVAADPTHAHAWQAWGVFELRRGRPDAAQALFKRGLRLCPSHGALWQAWGVLETSRGNFGRARQLFERGSQACPSHVHLTQAWACMEVRCGSIDRARRLLDHALESDPCHGPVWNAYGLLEARHGTLAKARQNFMTGIRRAPNHAPLYRTFGQTEASAGNYERARNLFREGLRVDPRHAPLYHALAEFEAMLGNVAALSELKQQAEKYFGSEADAVRALRSGEETLAPEEVSSEENMDLRYDAKATPMELALDGGNFFEN